MGKVYVGLFDENREPVMVMYWGDLWTGSQKGFFYTLFYDQTGSADSQFSGYLYTTFTRTGNLWWEPWMGGEGAIYSTINGVAGDVPLAECDNCSRVIKYVVTYGARYGSDVLVQMRVHDVNVLTDLSRTDPNDPDPAEPVSLDGSSQGTDEGRGSYSWIPGIEKAQAKVMQWWTWPWPELHTKFEQTSSDGPHMLYQVKCDILSQSQVEACSLQVGTEDPIDEQSFYNALADNVVAIWAADLYRKLAILAAGFAASILCNLCIAGASPWALAAAVIAVGIYTALFVWDVAATVDDAIAISEYPLKRWWIIVATMMLVVLGWVGYGLLVPYAGYLAAQWAKDMAAGLSGFFQTMTSANLVFLAWKIYLVGYVFLVATSVLVATLLGWC